MPVYLLTYLPTYLILFETNTLVAVVSYSSIFGLLVLLLNFICRYFCFFWLSAVDLADFYVSFRTHYNHFISYRIL